MLIPAIETLLATAFAALKDQPPTPETRAQAGRAFEMEVELGAAPPPSAAPPADEPRAEEAVEEPADADRAEGETSGPEPGPAFVPPPSLPNPGEPALRAPDAPPGLPAVVPPSPDGDLAGRAPSAAPVPGPAPEAVADAGALPAFPDHAVSNRAPGIATTELRPAPESPGPAETAGPRETTDPVQRPWPVLTQQSPPAAATLLPPVVGADAGGSRAMTGATSHPGQGGTPLDPRAALPPSAGPVAKVPPEGKPVRAETVTRAPDHPTPPPNHEAGAGRPPAPPPTTVPENPVAPVPRQPAPAERVESTLAEVTLHIGHERRAEIAAPAAPASTAHPLAEPRHVIRQVAERVAESSQNRIEITLTPEELGKVRVVITQGDSPIVTVHAENRDTLDLMRRNGELLARELRETGLGGATISFGDGGTDGSRMQQPERLRFGRSGPAGGEAEETTARTPHRPSAGRQIDIRI